MATAKTESNEKALEQKHLDNVLKQIKEREKSLKKSIKSAEGEARDINSHFFDDVKLDYDGYSTSMETALSIHQQQQLLSEREHAWQHSAKQLSTAERLEKRPYFARIDFKEQGEKKPETIYVGLGSFADKNDHFLIYDWRAPISSIYYDGKLGKVSYNSPEGEITVDMTKKRQFMIKDGKIINMFDTNESIGDQMLLEVLSEKSSTQMKSIVTTIQREQNKIIRNTSADLLFVQGAAGSGKTSAILQRIAFLLYRYRGNLTSSDVIMFSPNQLFNDYIKNVLPEMGEQNMVQMTYWQFVARRLPGMNVENLFKQFEDQTADTNISKFKDSVNFFNLLTRYAKHLNERGMIFKNIYFRDKKKPYFDKKKIKEIYYSYNQNYNLANRIDATREELIKMLNRKIAPEARKAWVSRTIEGLSQEQLNDLYDRPDQEFESEKKEEAFLGRKIVLAALKGVHKRILHNHFINMRAQYLSFLRAVPKMMDLGKWDIDEAEWMKHVEEVKENFKSHNIAMNDVSAYLYLYDLITGRRTDFEMRYAFIDEIQDYTPFQLAYLKYNFPRAKFTMLGDLNQAIFTKDESRSLLKQISGLFDPEKTDVVQLTKSYRSTKQLTDFTKQILRQGEKIEAFNRQGPKPVIWGRKTDKDTVNVLVKVLKENEAQHFTTAIITKDLASARFVHEQLKAKGEKATLIATANQRLVDGTLVIPSYLAKGLEFDAVIMWGASKENYHQLDETQLVYTITSRAMYKLDVIYTGTKSPLLDVDSTTYEEK
ncbi:RNA polymerase recycling motor HelD [Lactobacillus kefiranofaciens]|uniref:DNA helicase-2 / ATP-dependent DNA helicase PcrA n=1 Tax=Lactobacillus kefiranofaciens TaxID=267818 RepID=A0AAX3UD82_9LACO|nr:RNA polymerase recycling motor HelD [Lactobacillus kefiranofaciens]AEG40942.1 ATP-dependent DNA helicase [Lactobacillus kefiranofaciens subsp. kefiranofaciens]KRL30873.1 ATP-dependent DNA helicase [Lactobacillus kefiranofaciens subsp. kefirgranum DSM 10550 = JCM 8572]KRM22009.1 ATP-dependent DNA helicase [Lactobacillus kefiranofaciens subsp. kefiranofaciens DSM 5016 = JCM 6985]MCP9331159.1 AAA family ATPase [Lactobacillus kefiranofaciens]MDF4142633.1 RNA polymerase recycling motor HelD [Lac